MFLCQLKQNIFGWSIGINNTGTYFVLTQLTSFINQIILIIIILLIPKKTKNNFKSSQYPGWCRHKIFQLRICRWQKNIGTDMMWNNISVTIFEVAQVVVVSTVTSRHEGPGIDSKSRWGFYCVWSFCVLPVPAWVLSGNFNTPPTKHVDWGFG